MDLPLQTIRELRGPLDAGEISPVELTAQTLARIAALQPHLNAFITVCSEEVLAQARQAEQELRSGRRRGPLHGVPYALKDLFVTRGICTTGGSKVYADYTPDEDAAIVERLRDAGAVLIGKANLHENAYGITSANPHFQPVKNPWDLERIPGGSSGGSTAALAAGLCSFAIGTDTGGSIRIPASFCGVTGFKPSFGRVSRFGCFPLGHTLDHVGPFALSVEEAAWVYQAMAGPDPRDESSLDEPVEAPDFKAEARLDGCRIGRPRSFYFDDADPEVVAAVDRALEDLESLGASVIDVDLPDIEEANAVARLILLAEAAAVHLRNLDRRPQDFGPDQRALFDQGRFISAVDYLNAQRLRRLFRQDFLKVFDDVDVLATPAVAILPAKIGQTKTEVAGVEHDVRLATTRNARALNLIGVPLLSLPCGFSQSRLPIGLQLVGGRLADRRLLEIAHAYQQATDWHRRRPAIAAVG